MLSRAVMHTTATIVEAKINVLPGSSRATMTMAIPLISQRRLISQMRRGWAAVQMAAVPMSAVLMIAGLSLSLPLRAAEPLPVTPDKRTRHRLAQPIQLAWSRVPLRQALQNLAASQQLAILLDRRIDPDQAVEFTLPRQPLESALHGIADHLHIDLSLFGPIVYFGPPRDAQRLRTLAALRHEQVARLPAAARVKLVEPRVWKWEALTTPAGLLEQLSRQAGVEIDGRDQIPHDLWPAVELPPLPWIDRLALVAVQFGLTFDIAPDGKSVRLVPLPDEAVLRRSYAAEGNAKALAARWTDKLPQARVRAEGGHVVIEGRVEDHELVTLDTRRANYAAARAGLKAKGKDIYQLSVRNAELNAVLKHFADRSGYELKIDKTAIDHAGISLEQLVTVEVKDATLDDLLRAVLDPIGLTYTHSDRSIEIFPKDESQLGAKPVTPNLLIDPPSNNEGGD